MIRPSLSSPRKLDTFNLFSRGRCIRLATTPVTTLCTIEFCVYLPNCTLWDPSLTHEVPSLYVYLSSFSFIQSTLPVSIPSSLSSFHVSTLLCGKLDFTLLRHLPFLNFPVGPLKSLLSPSLVNDRFVIHPLHLINRFIYG